MAGGNGNLKIIITIFIVIIGYVVTGLSSHFTTKYSLQNEINLLRKDVEYQKIEIIELKATKPGLLKLRFDVMKEDMDELKENNKTMLDLLDEILDNS